MHNASKNRHPSRRKKHHKAAYRAKIKELRTEALESFSLIKMLKRREKKSPLQMKEAKKDGGRERERLN